MDSVDNIYNEYLLVSSLFTWLVYSILFSVVLGSRRQAAPQTATKSVDKY